MTIPADSPPWLVIAYSYQGQREIKGPQTAPFIAHWLQKLGAWYKDDESAWCGTFIAGTLEECNEKYGTRLTWPKFWMRALAYSPGYGIELKPSEYRPGAICTKRRVGGGHVFYYVGENESHIYGIAGNTSDSVKEAWYPKDELVGVVWPAGAGLPCDGTNRRNFLTGGPTAPVHNKED